MFIYRLEQISPQSPEQGYGWYTDTSNHDAKVQDNQINWAAGEPNNDYNIECAVLNRAADDTVSWTDENCNEIVKGRNTICQFDPKPDK